MKLFSGFYFEKKKKKNLKPEVSLLISQMYVVSKSAFSDLAGCGVEQTDTEFYLFIF